MSKLTTHIQARQWLPILGITFSAFVFNTSEFIPISLLSDIAADFNITEARAGMLISVYALVVTIMSLPLMLLVSKMEFRKLLLGTLMVFIASQILCALSPSFITLLLSRISMAAAHSVFWGIAAPMAVRIAPEGKKSAALGMISAGTSIAMILGLPLGRVIGLYVGWRMTFICIAVAAFLILILLFFVFPKMPNTNPLSLKKIPSLFKNRALMGIYLFTALTVTAHYTAYSYIEPFLGQVAGLGESMVTLVLIIIGIAGIIGSILFSRYFDKSSYLFTCLTTVGISFFLLILHLSSFNAATIILVCLLWGISIATFNLISQTKIIQFEPRAATIAMAVYSGVYNLGISSGTSIGSSVYSYISISYVGYIGGAIGLVASVYCIKRLVRILKIT